MARTFQSRPCHRLLPCFILLIFLFGSSSAWGESQSSKGSWGFYGGVNVASLGGDFDEFGRLLADGIASEVGGDWTSSSTSRSDLGLGLYYLFNLSPTFGLQIEGQYIRRGGAFDLKGTSIPGFGSLDMDLGFKLSYLEIPVLLRYRGSPDAKVRPVLLGGPVIGFKVGASMEASAEGESESADFSDQVKSTAFGLLVGAGIAIDTGKTTAVVIQGRYYLGLSEPFEDSTISSKSGDFGFFAGLEFALGPKGE